MFTLLLFYNNLGCAHVIQEVATTVNPHFHVVSSILGTAQRNTECSFSRQSLRQASLDFYLAYGHGKEE